MPDLRELLESIPPPLRTALLALVTFAVLYVWRRAHAASFEKLPKTLQEFPALFVATVLAFVTAKVAGIADALQQAGTGPLAGLGAIGLHWFLKNQAWIPYGNGNTPAPAAPGVINRVKFGALVLLALLLPSCGGASLPAGVPAIPLDQKGIAAALEVVQWMRDHDVDAKKIEAVAKAIADKDVATAAAELAPVVQTFIDRGEVDARTQILVDVVKSEAARIVGETMAKLSTTSVPDARGGASMKPRSALAWLWCVVVGVLEDETRVLRAELGWILAYLFGPMPDLEPA